MTTIESESMITWLTPAMMVLSESGNSTLKSVCRGVEPKACAASTVSLGTCWMPSIVSLTAGGMAKTTVAIRAGGSPMPSRTMIGTR